ncbi:hypothetical protein [Lysobacter claricitrinus]|uniref:hypothetical protein n=1 Tax=Lysobacter claricitrinus TaxID=3367728 RepID=UPI0037DAEE50
MLKLVGGLAVAYALVGSAAAQQPAAPATTASSTQVVVNRDSGKMGSLCATELYVDGTLVGRVSPGQQVTLATPSGAKELMAKPALESYICKKIYSLPQWERRVTLTGQPVTVRYGFTGKGEPIMEASP